MKEAKPAGGPETRAGFAPLTCRLSAAARSASAPHGVENPRLDGVRRAVRADHGLGVGLSASLVQLELLGELTGVEVPAVEGAVLVVGDHRTGRRIHRGGVDAP